MLEQASLSAHLHELDRHQFGSLVEPFRRELRAHCYRMLGSLQEAEEMVQETFLRAWSRRETYAGRATLRAWLYKIATNLCLDALRRKPRRSLPIRQEPASTPEQPIPASIYEPIWLEPYPAEIPATEENNPEARFSRSESIRLAFLAALQLLPPYQRAVLILRDVLDWPASEVAVMLDHTLPSVKSALYRARSTLAQHQPNLQPETMMTHISDEELQNLLERYVQAWETGNVQSLVALLSEDCTFSMPPTPSWYRGRPDIAGLVGKTIFSGPARGRWRLLPTSANAQPGFGLYQRSESSGDYTAYGIQVVAVSGSQISDITTFRTPALIEIFSLPPSLAA
jgi:RNA polymerase sigma-70 factor (ECF subfamily)